MKKILITGAGGFLGKYVSEQFALSGQYEVYAVISARGGVKRSVEFPAGVVVKKADLLHEEKAADLMAEIRPDVLCHLAWSLEGTDYRKSSQNMDWLAASIILLKHFIHAGGKQFFFAGSSAEYGNGNPGIAENDRSEELSMYGFAKKLFVQAAECCCRTNDVIFTCARYFSIYGPGDDKKASAIPAAILSLLEGKKFVCKAPYNIWDFVYVEDCARAAYQLVEHECAGSYNVASGKPQRMKDVFGLISELLQCEELVEYNTDSTAFSLTADTSRLREAVGNVCSTPFREGLEKTVVWWKHRYLD